MRLGRLQPITPWLACCLQGRAGLRRACATADRGGKGGGTERPRRREHLRRERQVRGTGLICGAATRRDPRPLAQLSFHELSSGDAALAEDEPRTVPGGCRQSCRHRAVEARGSDFLYLIKAAPPAPRGAVSDAAASARAGRAASGRSPRGALLRDRRAAYEATSLGGSSAVSAGSTCARISSY